MCIRDRDSIAQSNLVEEGCPQTSPVQSQSGATLEDFSKSESADGVVFNEAGSHLELSRVAGNFTAATIPITDSHNASCEADFDGDGWTDLVVGTSSNRFISVYRNTTFNSPEPDWDDPNDIRTPSFEEIQIRPVSSGSGHATLACGDFNGDGHQDFAYWKNLDASQSLYRSQELFLGNGDNTFGPGGNNTSTPVVSDQRDLGQFQWTSRNNKTFDYNGDGWTDIIWGTKLANNNNSGAVLALINNCPDVYDGVTPCSQTPLFVAQTIVSGENFGNRGMNAIAIEDFDGDGNLDLVAGSPSFCEGLKYFPGVTGGGFDTVNTRLIATGTGGGATVILSKDLSLDGIPDIAFGGDGVNGVCTSNGGQARYYQNNGTTTPFSDGETQQLTRKNQPIGDTGVQFRDFDVGSAFDYDHDPDGTIDFIMADGNNSGSYLIFANRVDVSFVDCGEVASGVLDLGDLSDEELVITGARIDPTMVVPSGTDVTFELSNENPENWQTANPCSDNPTEFCVNFPRPVGREVRWRAILCTDSTKRKTPQLSQIDISFDYTEAEEHYRSGVVVRDGVVYAGAFRQPGNRGHFYALDADLTQTYWDAASKLDAMSDSERHIYVSADDGQSTMLFENSNAANLTNRLGVASEAQANNVIDWARRARFGIASTAVNASKLGSVETSTPAIVSPPPRPSWYNFVASFSADLKVELDEFLSTHADRPDLVMFGSRDGMIHAVHTSSTDISRTINGDEAWAFIPNTVASRMQSDVANNTSNAYPDGSPTLADVRLTDSTGDSRYATVAIVSSGNGGSGITALDVTNTVAEDGTILGPKPLWEMVPGGSLAGQGFSTPAVARVLMNGTERFISIFGTGISYDEPSAPYTRGREVLAVDMSDGTVLWRLQTECPITSDILLYETDDEFQDLGSTIDGFVDRAVWADLCGNMYKVNPAQEPAVNSNNPWISSLGDIDTGFDAPDGSDITAFFSTNQTLCAIGENRPIAGTIGATSTNNGRLVLYAGTGGLESFDPNLQNDFYAIYADNGQIRGVEESFGDCTNPRVSTGILEGTCDENGQNCEKFYGGVVVTSEQVVLTRAVDPPIGQNTCETGTSVVTALDLASLTNAFDVTTNSATVSSLFGQGDAIYFATLSGEIVRVGSPRAGSAGGDSTNGGAPVDSGIAQGGAGGVETFLIPRSWRRLE